MNINPQKSLLKTVKDAEQDFLRFSEEEEINPSVDETITESIPSNIKQIAENVTITNSSDFTDIEDGPDKRPNEESINFYCIYCTRYKRIKTVCDVKPGDSIRFQRCKGVYYHHATVKEVKKTSNPTACNLTLIHLQKVGIPIMSKVIEDKKDYDFQHKVIEKVIHKSNPLSPDEIVQRAEEYILQNPKAKCYNLTGNNCEHISILHAQGVSVSHQVIRTSDQVKAGISWLLFFYKHASKKNHTREFEAFRNMCSLFIIIVKMKTLDNFLTEKIVCSCCFYREYNSLYITLAINVISLVNSVINHPKSATFLISTIVGIPFLSCDSVVMKYFIPLVQPAYFIPKHEMIAKKIPTAGDVITFVYCSLPHEGVVTEVCGYKTDKEIAKATIVHFPWPGLFRRYIVTEEDICLKLSDAVFVVDHNREETYLPTEVVNRAKKCVGDKNHNSLTYRSSHLARYCKTGEKKLKDLPKRPVMSIEDVSPGDVIKFKYCGLPHEAVVTKIGYAENVETKVVHYNYNGLVGSREVVEEKITFSSSNANNYIHDYTSEDTYEAEEVVRRARSRVGEKKFNVFKNRSSHLAKWCKVK